MEGVIKLTKEQGDIVFSNIVKNVLELILATDNQGDDE